MKRLAALIPAAVALAAGVCCIPAVSASAAEVTLTVSQTLALFGNTLACSYKNQSDVLVDGTFSYYGMGVIDETHYSDLGYLYKFDPTNSSIIVYRSDFSDIINDGSTSNFSLKLKPAVSLSGLNSIQLSLGISCNPLYVQSFTSSSYGANNKIEYRYLIQGNSTSNRNSATVIQNHDGYYNNYLPVYNRITFLSSDGNTAHQVPCNMMQVKQTESNSFTFFTESDYASDGFFSYRWITRQNDGYYYFYIACPTLSDTYVNNNPPESSGGGSESSGSGYDGPDYTDQLALILAKLDLIINNDFNFDVNLEADLSGVESRLDGVNSRLDGNNSRLDGNNSRLDGVNSRLDGVNSRLDNISGELHDLNSAPSDTFPSTGGENSEFDHQAEMYMSDFRNEFEDSENQVFEVIDKGTGFLGFVREIIITSHLAQILPLLALLFIAHYVIFERGG